MRAGSNEGRGPRAEGWSLWPLWFLLGLWVLLAFVLPWDDCGAAPVNFAWDPVPDSRVTGYELGWGAQPGAYQQYQPAPGTAATLDLPEPGPHYIAVRALGADPAITSAWSNEVVWLADLAGTQPLAQSGLWARYTWLWGPPVMAAPTFVAEYVTAFNSATSPKTAMNAVSINSGDVIVLVGATEDAYNADPNMAPSYTENGSASLANYTENTAASYAPVSCGTYVATSSETLTTTVVRGVNNQTTKYFGGNAIRFSASNGIGAIATGSGSGAPSFSITTTEANSAIVVIIADWNANSGTQTFTSSGGAGSATALSDYPGDSVHYGVAIAYYADAGTAGSKTVGMSAPSNQTWRGIAIEVKGSASAATTSLPHQSYASRMAHLLGR